MKAKLTCMIFGMFLLTSGLKAQHVVRFSPLSLVKNKAKLHYEYGGLNKMGLGVIASGYYGIYPGFRVQPFFRYYLTNESLNGLYVQPKFHYSNHSYEISVTVNGETSTEDYKFDEMGASLSLGWQWLVGSNDNIAVDIFTGYRWSNLHGKFEETLESEGADDAVGEGAYSLLHSSAFDLGLSVGFKF